MRIIWSHRAIAHLESLREFIARDKPEAALRVAQQVVECVELLTRHPNMGRPGRVAGTRELIVPGTPYLIPYRVRDDRVEIIAVFHGRQMWPKEL